MDICLNFNLLAPHALNDFSFFDIGQSRPYTSSEKIKEEFLEHFESRQQPLLDAIRKTGYRFNLYLSGLFLELLSEYKPKDLKTLQELVKTAEVELLAGSYYQSLSCLISNEAFEEDVAAHSSLIEDLFTLKPTCFCNTENVYSNKIAHQIKRLKFKSAIVPAIDWYIGGSSEGQGFLSTGDPPLSLLLIDRALSHSIAAAGEIPSSPRDRLLVAQFDPNDYGQVDWEWIFRKIKGRENDLTALSEAVDRHKGMSRYNIPGTLALNTRSEDLSFFLENTMQKEIFEKMAAIYEQLDAKEQQVLLRLSHTDSFLAMTNKAHIANAPHEHYLKMMNILADMELRV